MNERNDSQPENSNGAADSYRALTAPCKPGNKSPQKPSGPPAVCSPGAAKSPAVPPRGAQAESRRTAPALSPGAPLMLLCFSANTGRRAPQLSDKPPH